MVAIVAATAALWLTLNLTNSWQRVTAAAVMAVAVCGMHYTAMLATSFAISSDQMTMVDSLSNAILAAAVSLGVFLILCLAMVCVFVDRRFELLAEREAESLRAANGRLRGEIEERRVIARELLASNAALTGTQAAIRNLLDNADQGFLTIGADLLVGDQSSAACEAILGKSPAGRSIIGLLCPGALPDAEAAVRTTLESVFRDSSDFIREIKLGLLPAAFVLNETSIKAGYKYLADSHRLMLILTDVTQTTLLTEAVERERKRLEMIVLAVTEGEAFTALVNDYRKFLTEVLPPLLEQTTAVDDSELPRRLHTYKGLLAQFSFHYSPQRLHDLESILSAGPAIRQANETSQALLGELRRDLESVSDVLGTDLATPSGRRITLSQHQLQAMEQIAKDALAGEDGRTASLPLRQLLQTLAGLGKLDVKASLVLHSRGASALAVRLQKQLAPIRIEGDDAGVPPQIYGEFFRSLVHVFRNAVDHGIETPEERKLAGKPPEGAIRCTVRDRGDLLEILIEDDGRGVDRCRLEDKLVAAGLEPFQVKSLSLKDLVFREGLSSREAASEVSGRGIGLDAVKTELDHLGGSVAVESEYGIGTRFRFLFATRSDAPLRNIPALEMIAT